MTADRTDTAPDVGLSKAVAEALAAHDGMPWLFGDENIPTLTKDERAVYLSRAAAVLTAVEAAHARDHAALRERAEVAEAKVAAVAAHRVILQNGEAHIVCSCGDAFRSTVWPNRMGGSDAVVQWAAHYRAALADRPADHEPRP